ncbi:MAG: NAD(P)-dependent oxidoreductase [Clostridia bacterium]|nr:NAD(P)-dependent oxidoreductase [Clostridia bacterium]
MRRAIITGATGTVGTALIEELTRHQIEVMVLCRKESRRLHQLPENPYVKKVFCALDQLSQLNNDQGLSYDVFFHMGWEGTIGPERDDMYLQNRNVKYALDAVETAKRFGCRHFVGVGSQAEYGFTEGILRPDTPVHPEMGYGIGKLTAGLMTREHAHQLGMEHIWVRLLSIYGPNDGPQSLIMSTIHKIQSGETPRLTKGEQWWDYLYSGDAAKALMLLSEKGHDGKTYVLGNGKVRQLKEYVNDIREVIRPDASLEFGAIPYYDHQVMYLQADISDVVADTGWYPETEFKDGIRKIIQGSLRKG